MRTLVFGKSGQVGRELARSRGVVAIGRDECDLSVAGAASRIIADATADVVINAAAYTAVDQAENEPDFARRLNADAPAEMAVACTAKGVPFLHISTDYVFDGSGEHPWAPNAPINPLNAYGRGKAEGEAGVMGSGGCAAILRTSWVFSEFGRNFVTTMQKLGGERAEVSIVADQIGGPTPAKAIADALMEMARQILKDPSKQGLYHLSGAPNVSWAEFAGEIFAQCGFGTKIRPIPTADYPTPARRPLNSRLDCSSLREVFGIEQPDWRQSLALILEALKGADGS